MAGMMNICESVIKTVRSNKPKWLTGLSQTASGEEADCIVPPRGHYSPRSKAGIYPRALFKAERGNPVSLPVRSGQRIAKSAYGGAGLGCRKKPMPCCNGADTG